MDKIEITYKEYAELLKCKTIVLQIESGQGNIDDYLREMNLERIEPYPAGA